MPACFMIPFARCRDLMHASTEKYLPVIPLWTFCPANTQSCSFTISSNSSSCRHDPIDQAPVGIVAARTCLPYFAEAFLLGDRHAHGLDSDGCRAFCHSEFK